MLRMQWFKENYLDNWNGKKNIHVLDVGSQCVPGQNDTYKVFFESPYNNIYYNQDGRKKEPYRYTGLDMVEGYNVDIVVKNPYRWDEVADDSYDVVISGQMFEHVEFPWLTIAEMARVLKPGGFMCIIAPSMSGLHRYPVNCQNFFSDGLIALAKYAGLEPLHASTHRAPEGADVEWYNPIQDTILVARKPLDWKQNRFDVESYRLEVADLEKMATGLVPMNAQKWYRKYKIKTYIKYIFSYPLRQLTNLLHK